MAHVEGCVSVGSLPVLDIGVTLNTMTSSNGDISALLAICAVTGEFPAQKPLTRSLDAFFDLRPNKQSRGWWFETPSRPLWRHCNDWGFRITNVLFSQLYIMLLLLTNDISIKTAIQGVNNHRIHWIQFLCSQYKRLISLNIYGVFINTTTINDISTKIICMWYRTCTCCK